jgi:amino-acid N-acetyltransferase
MTTHTTSIQLIPVLPPVGEVVVRPALERDVPEIAEVVRENVRLGHLLPRSEDNIRSSLANWLVGVVNERVVGIGSLVEMSPVLAEVRSLAVLPEYQSFGVGANIVTGLVERARHYGYPTVFALTRAVRFFEKLGFSVTEKERFPEKVWTVCVVCPLVNACDETAVVIELG